MACQFKRTTQLTPEHVRETNIDIRRGTSESRACLRVSNHTGVDACLARSVESQVLQRLCLQQPPWAPPDNRAAPRSNARLRAPRVLSRATPSQANGARRMDPTECPGGREDQEDRKALVGPAKNLGMRLPGIPRPRLPARAASSRWSEIAWVSKHPFGPVMAMRSWRVSTSTSRIFRAQRFCHRPSEHFQPTCGR